MVIFEKARIGNLEVSNRLVRSATVEGLCDSAGTPTPAYADLYRELAANGVGLIITGFCFVSKVGRAIQPGQGGIDSDDKIKPFSDVTKAVHQSGGAIIMQIAHCGRQTKSSVTGAPVLGVSLKRSTYFKEKPRVLTKAQIHEIIEQFANACARAKAAGFDGVQLHAAHGYLIHQFLLGSVNDRTDEFGIDVQTHIGTRFFEMTIDRIRDKCKDDYPLLVKVSGSDELRPSFSTQNFEALIQFLTRKRVTAIEISHGTMDHALNIFRGSTIPLNAIQDHDPVYRKNLKPLRYLWKKVAVPIKSKKIKPFSPMYNLPYAKKAKSLSTIPIISVGGFRRGFDIAFALESGGADFVSMCRPFIAEKDFANKLLANQSYESKCTNCNVCAIMTSSGKPTACYRCIER